LYDFGEDRVVAGTEVGEERPALHEEAGVIGVVGLGGSDQSGSMSRRAVIEVDEHGARDWKMRPR